MKYKLLFTVIFVLLLSACSILTDSSAPSTSEVVQQNKPESVYDKDSPISKMTDDNKYKISLHSNVFPIPLQKIHSWTAKIEYANGKPLETAKIYIHGGMPEHRHDFPTKPRVRKNLGNGVFLIEGVKFSMFGEWEMRINVLEKKQRDRAVFQIQLR